jgi:hypothetical protein
MTPLERPQQKMKDNIKMKFEEINKAFWIGSSDLAWK